MIETKLCPVCNATKLYSEFPKKKSTSSGIYPYCRECKNKQDRENYQKNRDKALLKAKEHYQNNRERILAKNAENKEKKAEYSSQYFEKNRDKLIKRNREWKEQNKEYVKDYRKQYRVENREQIREYEKEYYSIPLNRLKKQLRKRVQEILVSKGFVKDGSNTETIGCSDIELIKHMESQFSNEMTWDNYGSFWVADHIIPISNGMSAEQVQALNHYLNLKPLPIDENLKKNNLRSDMCWQKLQRDKLIKEDLESGFNFNLKASEFVLANEEITDEHRLFIERYEWLGTCGFGVRYVFTARHEGKLAGVVMVAEPNAYQFDIKLEALIQRGACSSWAPKNLNSRLVMFACNWMVKNTDKRIFVAYSDPKAGEIGTIYQACNFDYLGQEYGSKNGWLLENGKIVSDRHFTRTSSMKKWCKELGIEWQKDWCKPNGFQDTKKIPLHVKEMLSVYIKEIKSKLQKTKQERKGKYVLLLKNNRKEKIQKTWEPKPYPKRLK